MAVVTGTETLQVLGQNPTGKPAASTFPTTTQQIAQLAGTGAFGGTFTLTGTTPVVVNNTNVIAGLTITYSLETPGGTVGAYPIITTKTNGASFTVSGTALDTSTYNYAIGG